MECVGDSGQPVSRRRIAVDVGDNVCDLADCLHVDVAKTARPLRTKLLNHHRQWRAVTSLEVSKKVRKRYEQCFEIANVFQISDQLVVFATPRGNQHLVELLPVELLRLRKFLLDQSGEPRLRRTTSREAEHQMLSIEHPLRFGEALG